MKSIVLFIGALGSVLTAYSQKKIVVMGSSTAAGTGASSPDSAWVGRLQKFYRQNTGDGADTVIYNIAWYGQTTYSQMPTGWVSPIADRPAIDPDHNVTKALSFSPDVVIINLPSNDVANLYWGPAPNAYTTKETMDNFRTMAQVFTSNNVPAFFTTTQPRDDIDDVKRTMLRQLVDSINNQFVGRSIDFWNPIVTTDGQNKLKPELKSDDIHVNNTGHRLLYEQVITKNLFGNNPAPPPPPPPAGAWGRIQAENWTSMSGVQTEVTNDAGGGLNVGYIDQNDWMEYAVNAPAQVIYTLSFRVAAQQAGAQIHIMNGSNLLNTITLPATGGWQSWQTISTTVSLPAGNQLIRLVSGNATNWNINWFEFSTGSVTPTANYTSLPAKIEAENYSGMSGVQTETTSDAGGGLNVGYIDQNDWMEYNVSTSTAGSFTLKLRVAATQTGGSVEIRSNGQLLTTFAIPNTNGWQNFQTLTATVNLPAGNQVIRLLSVAAVNWNINWLEFASASTAPPPASNHIEAEQYTAMSGIQTETTSDAGGGQNVGYIDLTDWMEYTINPSNSGSYTLSFRVAALQAGGRMELRTGNGTFLTSLDIPSTGGWQNWTTITKTVNLSAGAQTIRIISTQATNWNINWWEWNPATTTPPVTTRIEAENFLQMSGIQTESTNDAGGGLNVGYIDQNDWMSYTVQTNAAGNYTCSFRVAALQAGAQFAVQRSDGSVLATVTVPTTGGWQNWITVNASLALAAGTQVIKIVSLNATNWNINWWEIGSAANVRAPAIMDDTRLNTRSTEIFLYPNPARDRIKITLPEAANGLYRVQWVNMQGAVCLQAEGQMNSGVIEAGVQTLKPGTYIVMITGKSVAYRTKMIKE